MAFPNGPGAISKALELAVSCSFLGRDLLASAQLSAFGGSSAYPGRGAAAAEASSGPRAGGSLSCCPVQQPGTTLALFPQPAWSAETTTSAGLRPPR